MAATAPPWWLVVREAQPRAENLIPNMILQNGRSSSSCKNCFITAPNCRKVTDAMIEDFCDLIEWNCCYYIPFIRSTLSIWPLQCCYCTSHIVRVFANIRLSPECDGSQGSLRCYESGRRVFSLGSVSQNTVIIIVQPPVQHWAVSSRAVNEPSRSFTVPGDHQTVCWLWPLWTHFMSTHRV